MVSPNATRNHDSVSRAPHMDLSAIVVHPDLLTDEQYLPFSW